MSQPPPASKPAESDDVARASCPEQSQQPRPCASLPRRRSTSTRAQIKAEAKKAEKRRENRKRQKENQKEAARKEAALAAQQLVESKRRFWTYRVAFIKRNAAAVEIQRAWRKWPGVLARRAQNTVQRIDDTLRLLQCAMAERLGATRAARSIQAVFRAHHLAEQKKELGSTIGDVGSGSEERVSPSRSTRKERMREASEAFNICTAEKKSRTRAVEAQQMVNVAEEIREPTRGSADDKEQKEPSGRAMAQAGLVQKNSMKTGANEVQSLARQAEIAYRDKPEEGGMRLIESSNNEGETKPSTESSEDGDMQLSIEAQWVSSMLDAEARALEVMEMARAERESKAAANYTKKSTACKTKWKLDECMTTASKGQGQKVQAERKPTREAPHHARRANKSNGKAKVESKACNAGKIRLAGEAEDVRVESEISGDTDAGGNEKPEKKADTAHVKVFGESNKTACSKTAQGGMCSGVIEKIKVEYDFTAQGIVETGDAKAQKTQPPSPASSGSDNTSKSPVEKSSNRSLKRAARRRECRRRRQDQKQHEHTAKKEQQSSCKSDSKSADESTLMGSIAQESKREAAPRAVMEISGFVGDNAARSIQRAWRIYQREIRKQQISVAKAKLGETLEVRRSKIDGLLRAAEIAKMAQEDAERKRDGAVEMVKAAREAQVNEDTNARKSSPDREVADIDSQAESKLKTQVGHERIEKLASIKKEKIATAKSVAVDDKNLRDGEYVELADFGDKELAAKAPSKSDVNLKSDSEDVLNARYELKESEAIRADSQALKEKEAMPEPDATSAHDSTNKAAMSADRDGSNVDGHNRNKIDVRVKPARGGDTSVAIEQAERGTSTEVTADAIETKQVLARRTHAGEETGTFPRENQTTSTAHAVATAEKASEASTRADMERRLMEKVTEFLQKRNQEATAAAAAAQKQAAKLAELRSRLQLPPSRKHVEKGPQEWQIFPLQDQPGQNVMYKDHEWGRNLPALMNTLRGFHLALGAAPVCGCNVARAAEEFAVVCGFSAAFGPLLLKKAVGGERVNRRYGLGYDHMPVRYIMEKFERYWRDEVVEFDADERFFRLVRKDSSARRIRRADLQPFVLAMAQRHPDLSVLSSDEASVYVDTVLAIIFYDCSRRGVLTLADLRKTGLALSVTYFGSWELSKETTGFKFADPPPRLPLALRQKVQRIWSLTRHEKIRRDFLSLCGGGWTVSVDDLADYGQDGGRPVGFVRAKRVLDAGVRLFLPGESPGGVIAAGSGYGQDLDYDSFVSFYVCEEALRAGKCAERDVTYCFTIVDERSEGKLGLMDFDRFYKDTKARHIAHGQGHETGPSIEQIVCQYAHSLGIAQNQEHITIKDMTRSGDTEQAGRFFEELFSGRDLETHKYTEKESGAQSAISSTLPSMSPPHRDDVYPQSALEFERELADICRDLL